MKTAFRQQVSEYDCVPTAFVNALIYLFERKEIPPFVLQRIYSYCLDGQASKGRQGRGTTGLAVQLASQWLDAYRHDTFKLDAQFCDGSEVHLRQGNKIAQCLNGGGAVLLRVTRKSGPYSHYVLGLSMDEDRWLQCYDPYPMTKRANLAGRYEFLGEGGLHAPNLRIASGWLDKYSAKNNFHLGVRSERECVLLRRS